MKQSALTPKQRTHLLHTKCPAQVRTKPTNKKRTLPKIPKRSRPKNNMDHNNRKTNLRKPQ